MVLKPNPAASASQPPPAPPVLRVAGPTAPPPSPQPDTGRPPPSQAVQARFPVAVLSFFDGIATALHALKTLQVRPVLSWAWELDPEAIKVASSQHPEVVHHGDVFGRSPKDVLAAVSASVPKDTVLLLFAAPPCHDFSRIRSNPPGSSGKEGAKFDQFAVWLSEFRQASPFRVVFLVENVVMPLSMQQQFDDKLQCRSFACDASSWGTVSRPRIWWSNMINPPAENAREPPTIMSGQVRWRRLNRMWELIPNSSLFPKQVATTCPFAVFSNEVSSGRVRFPCLTTPAENPQGREPPAKKRRAESPDTLTRWKEANRAYPPWQFRKHALVKVAGKEGLPDPPTREWLQMLPSGYTAAVSPHSRARLLGNAWHAGVARLLVFVLLCQAGVTDANTVSNEQWYPPVPDPVFQVRWHPDGDRPLQRVASWWLRSGLSWDPTEPAQSELNSPGRGPLQHFAWTQQFTFATVFPATPNPCLEWTFQVQQVLGPRVTQVRQCVVQDLQLLVEELSKEQEETLQALPSHVATVYRQGTPHLRFQLLPLAWLLDLCSFPGRSSLLSELFWGFKLLGPLTPGSGWPNRDDARYCRPLPKTDFLSANAALARQFAEPTPPGEHTQTMLAELYKEKNIGRVHGPLPLELISTEGESPQLQVAKGFPVVQGDKVRRADDWLRSHHNSTVSASDAPPYMGAPTVVSGAIACSNMFESPPVLAAVDHEGAYRGMPVRSPTECGLVLPGSPPTLWSHFALPFGSVGSVWGYLRVADVVSFLSIVLLITFAAHYVDDFFMIEQSATANAAFAIFQAFHRLLGFRMKEEKSKPPQPRHTLLGIEWSFEGQTLFASPGQARVAKLIETIRGYLVQDCMSAAECSALTGKLSFTCTWVFNNVGRSFLQPLYFRQHHGNPGSSRLTPRVRQALFQLSQLLPELKPRRFSLSQHERERPVTHLYADAFITIHGVRRSARRWLEELPPLQELQTATNGFGAIVTVPGRAPVGFRGEVPTTVLADLASSRAYIFWLEALAQIVSVAVASSVCSEHVACWIDNTAAEHALNKGYSKDLRLSAIIGAFWIWAASTSFSVSFHRVASSENISDGISRGDTSDLFALDGELREISFDAVWPILQKFQADCEDYGHEFAQLVAHLSPQLRGRAESGFEAR